MIRPKPIPPPPITNDPEVLHRWQADLLAAVRSWGTLPLAILLNIVGQVLTRRRRSGPRL